MQVDWNRPLAVLFPVLIAGAVVYGLAMAIANRDTIGIVIGGFTAAVFAVVLPVMGHRRRGQFPETAEVKGKQPLAFSENNRAIGGGTL